NRAGDRSGLPAQPTLPVPVTSIVSTSPVSATAAIPPVPSSGAARREASLVEWGAEQRIDRGSGLVPRHEPRAEIPREGIEGRLGLTLANGTYITRERHLHTQAREITYDHGHDVRGEVVVTPSAPVQADAESAQF